ncbi:MliC family protein [Sagittula stellata]|uniref:Lipoprotein n=1 Tax=Sagittula stellata (strain ATCC 700073 / DSM 11524 / E-37) TaxID=388399 RepID=A3JY41_SAGS3|nr:MliC family protein [Sagittula stellata]EBA10427.1 hypothetical protein SSE37_20517 [Sagittula stellata E-37]
MKRIPTLSVFATLAMTAPGMAPAADPAFDCGKASGTVEEMICANDGLAELDREMARLYGLAVNDPDLGQERLDRLKAMQRGWIKGRNDCWKADSVEGCVAENYAMRMHELRLGYGNTRSDDEAGITIGPLAFVCGGLKAGISAVFVNGAEGLVSLRWDDRSLALTQAVSGSGARYEGESFDGIYEFWTKGPEALFTTPATGQLNCIEDDIG